MKIVDAFIFYNELDLLYYRLSILYDIVDYFIICESTRTFVGNTKKLYYIENKEKFKKFSDKIIHIIDDKLIENITNPMDNEIHQRNYLYEGIKQLNLDSNDKIIITDLDEIPDPVAINKIKEEKSNFNALYFEMDMYWYNLTCKCINKWMALPKIVSYDIYINKCDKKAHNVRAGHNFHCDGIVEPIGWHLSYFGDANFIRNKLEQFSHNEYNNKKYKSDENIIYQIKNYNDIAMRSDNPFIKIPISENTYLPPEYEKYLQKYTINIYEDK